jgi:tetratricopeptide (TPR) repeat protein
MLRRGGCYQVTEPLHAVFLSYASQDAQAAQRICEALRAAGIEVWFDQSELRGGDVWDQSIRRQIKSCALFIPVISRNTHARDEGYFRLEWKLAVDRSHLMSANRAFLLPVVIDDTRDGEEHVPDRFREVQWTRVPAGATPAAFVERVQRLTSNEVSAPIRRSTGTPSGTAEDMRAPVWAFRSPTRGLFVALTAVVLATSAYSAYSANSSTLATAGFEKSEADARQAIVLASELAEAHMALALVLQLGAHDFAQANEEYQRSLALAPGNAAVLRTSGEFAAHMGHFAAGIAAARRAVVLDPLDRASYATLGVVLYAARRYGEAATTYAEAISLDPQFKASYGRRGLALYGLGDLESARASCERGGDDWNSQWCLAIVYDKLGRHSNAEAELAKLKAASGDAGTYQYATVYAQWGDRSRALEWLDTALRVRDPGLELLKTDPLMDPLRHEPRFQAMLREVKFPTN